MSKFRCSLDSFQSFRSKNDGQSTQSFIEQSAVEDKVDSCYQHFQKLLEVEDGLPELTRKSHIPFLFKGLQHLSESYTSLDASRPWLCYWILHSLELLAVPLADELASTVVTFLSHCQNEDGGYGGGPGQWSHLAPTYAAVNALCIIGTEESFNSINRKALQSFLLRMRSHDGGFRMHDDGEIDIRGAYCAASVARLVNIATEEMFDLTPEWIVACQTYEGGFGGCPGMEAHGGYSFCGLAALVLLGKEHLCDIPALLRWTASRQMSFEGGFQGRTNKLVDGCYSFWQGGTFPIFHLILSKENDKALSANTWMFHREALQEYLLVCCQHIGGGLVDKPDKPRDYYHTCYGLSGLSIAQHFGEGKHASVNVLGNPENELIPTHPVFNIGLNVVQKARRYFGVLKVPSTPESDGIDTVLGS